MKLDARFQTESFDLELPVVYILGFERDNEFVPVYVGESGHRICRYADYVRAQFGAPTDFTVGEAVRCLIESGLTVLLKYRETPTDKMRRKGEERELMDTLKGQGFKLLNDLPSFSRLTADEEVEQQRIRRFVHDTYLASSQSISF